MSRFCTLGPRFHPVAENSGNYSLKEQFSVPRTLARERVDLFHAPHYVVSPFTTRPYRRHDPRLHSSSVPQHLAEPRRAALCPRHDEDVRKAKSRKVLTVVRASNDDILHYLDVPADKVEVIYNALDERL